MNINSIPWPEENSLAPVDYQINRLVQKLDDVVRGYEAIWGVGRLPELVPVELNEKWQRQIYKLNTAIADRDVAAVEELIDGTIRGWAALEQAAIQAGHNPIDPDVWEIKLSNGQILRICKNLNQARAKAEEGYVTWSLYEVANFIAAQGNKLNEVKEVMPGAEVTGFEFNWEEGDEVPL